MDEYQTEEESASIPEKAVKEHENILREYRERTFDRMLEMFRQGNRLNLNSWHVEVNHAGSSGYIFQSVSKSVNYLENMSYGVIRLLIVQATLVISGFVIIAIGGLI